MNLQNTDPSDLISKDTAESPFSQRSSGETRQRRQDQLRALLVIFCLMLASGHTLAWLFYSKYLQTYLSFQMEEYSASPNIELWLYFSMLFVQNLITPFIAEILFKTPLKAVLCFGSVFVLVGSISFIMCSSVVTFIIFQCTFTAIGTSLFQLAALLIAWEWFSPARRGLMSGVVVCFQSVSIAIVIITQLAIMEYKNLAPIEHFASDHGDVDIFPQKIAMKMILLYFFICGMQGMGSAASLALARRNEIQELKETRHEKQEIQVSKSQRKHIRNSIKQSNCSSAEQILIFHPGQNCPARYLTFWDAFRAQQLHILWMINFCQSAVIVIFSIQVIHACAKELDKTHGFCKSNLLAVSIAAALSPLFGLFNDLVGIRVNSVIGMLALSLVSFFMAQFEIFTNFKKFWFLLAAHIFINWQLITTSYACSRLFGIKCGIYCFAYVKLATVAAACATIIPLCFYNHCFDSEDCEQVMSYLLSGLLFLGALLSVFLNPKPLVQEDKDQFQMPSEQYSFVSTHNEVQF